MFSRGRLRSDRQLAVQLAVQLALQLAVQLAVCSWLCTAGCAAGCEGTAFTNRLGLLESWRGLRDAALSEAAGIVRAPLSPSLIVPNLFQLLTYHNFII